MSTETAPATASSLTGSDIPRPLSHFGSSRRDILPAPPAHTDTASTVTIASISDQDWYISRTHGIYHIPACPKPGASDQPYALLLITSEMPELLTLSDRVAVLHRGRLAAEFSHAEAAPEAILAAAMGQSA